MKEKSYQYSNGPKEGLDTNVVIFTERGPCPLSFILLNSFQTLIYERVIVEISRAPWPWLNATPDPKGAWIQIITYHTRIAIAMPPRSSPGKTMDS